VNMRNYPNVPVKNVTDTYFGREIVDPYRYLEDAKDPETLAVVQAQNEYTRRFFMEQTGFSAAAREAELRAVLHSEELSGVQEARGMICAARKLEGGIHDIVALDENMQVAGVILNEEMLDHRMHIFSAEPCPGEDGVYAVMGVIHGHPRCCIVIWDDREKKVLAELDGTFGYAWSPCGNYVYYSDAEVDAANNRNINRVRRYDWRAAKLETLYIHEENAVFIDVYPTQDGGCFFMVLNTYSDILVIWRDAQGNMTRLNDGFANYVYLGEAGGRRYFKTNANAPMSRVISISEEQLCEENSLMDGYEVAVAETDALLSAAGASIVTINQSKPENGAASVCPRVSSLSSLPPPPCVLYGVGARSVSSRRCRYDCRVARDNVYVAGRERHVVYLYCAACDSNQQVVAVVNGGACCKRYAVALNGQGCVCRHGDCQRTRGFCNQRIGRFNRREEVRHITFALCGFDNNRFCAPRVAIFVCVFLKLCLCLYTCKD